MNAPATLRELAAPFAGPPLDAPAAILVVDDDVVLRTLVTGLLRKLGEHEVVGLGDADEALDWCGRRMPDLVFTDYRLPGRDGLAFIRAFKALRGADEVPVVMLTSSEDRAVRHDALRGGAADFLAKPIDSIELLARGANLLSLRRKTSLLHQRAGWLEDEIQKALRLVLRREEEMLASLGRAAEFRDPETGAHLQRMSQYAYLVARELGLPEERRQAILRAAPMHDIGKLGTPDRILLKPGRLSEEEFEIMKQHASYGFEIIRHSGSPMVQEAATIALTHHEKWDGSGYPHGLAGTAIPIEGRIVAVADVFDALTSARPYKPAWDLERASSLLRDQAGRHFDPDCVDAFFAAWPDVLRVRAENPDA